MKDKKIMITGGAGFIGSNMVEALIDQNEVTVVDNLSILDDRFIKKFYGMKNFTFEKKDIKDKLIDNDYDLIVHLAADSDVRNGASDPVIDMNENVAGTVSILEFMRRNDVKNMMFASSSTVYGEASTIPTPEGYGPCMPISSYGASKLSAESFIYAYSHYYGIKADVYRFANIVGKNSTHGVIFDFINKLKKDPSVLEVLGDGTQAKSYLHVTDCINAMFFIHDKANKTDMYNLGNDGVTNVDKIARYVLDAMGLKNTEIVHRGGVNGRGWKGDVKHTEMDVRKMLSFGWKNKYSSDDAVKKAVSEIKQQMIGN
ncbi:MAG: NAD-dependent epimerase/dehydratase family protein [Thermoplasmata archaeon]